MAAIATAAAVPGLTGAQASNGKTQLLRIFDKPVAITLTGPSGQVTSHAPYPQPKPGDILDVYSLSLDYTGNHVHHATHWTMRSHLTCTFVQGPPTCESHIATGSSLLIFHGNKFVGGTGNYQGATGRILGNKEIRGTNNASDIVARIKWRERRTATPLGLRVRPEFAFGLHHREPAVHRQRLTGDECCPV